MVADWHFNTPFTVSIDTCKYAQHANHKHKLNKGEITKRAQITGVLTLDLSFMPSFVANMPFR